MKRVAPAISKGIAENKETMIDALYPIMGGMISKYVTQAIKELMESINKKIESGLSFESYKRKAKAKLSGVSETELLLEESFEASISALFVIHKETSLLIAEAHLENQEIDDAHMVASMASAIKDFINDWIRTHDTHSEVQILSYGNATLYIESAGSVYIIAFLDAEPDYEQRAQINAFFAKIVKAYAPFFQKFDGDDSSEEIVRLSNEMEEYLYAQQPVSMGKKKNPVKVILIIVTFLLAGYGIYLFNMWYIKQNLENTVYKQTGEQIKISVVDEKYVLRGQVSSTDVIYEIENIMKRHSKKAIDNELLVPMTYLDKHLKNDILERKLFILERKILSLSEALKESNRQLNALSKKKEKNNNMVEKEMIQVKENNR